MYSRVCERTLGPTPSTEDAAEALKKAGRTWKLTERCLQQFEVAESGRAFEAAHEYVARSMSSEIASGPT